MMMDWLEAIGVALEPHPRLYLTAVLIGLLVAAWLANFLTKRILLRALRRVLRTLMSLAEGGEPRELRLGVIPRLANVVPALVLMAGVELVPNLPEWIIDATQKIGAGFIILTVALAVAKALDLLNVAYERRPQTHTRTIKGYLQLAKIIVFAIAVVLTIAVLIDRSPLLLLSGMGAMMAVLILVFQDTLLSLVAGITVGSNDMIRVGDWIEMPAVAADGDVIDISLHTIKVQNWDKTISAIPMKRFLSDSFRNWRGMQEAGGRRIKRALYLDQTSVRFLEQEDIERLSDLRLLDTYLDEKEDELEEWNTALGTWAEKNQVNTRRMTNLGTFRAYALRYLQAHPGIHQGLSLMVRQLQPGATGIPLELYCFTTDVRWPVYEGVQSDIFDHLLAVLPQFDLRVFQNLSGHDMRVAVAAGLTR